MSKPILWWSGGLNSTAILYRLYEDHALPEQVIFCDTHAEYPCLYPFINQTVQQLRLDDRFTCLHPAADFWEYLGGVATKGKTKGQLRRPPMYGKTCWYRWLAKTIHFRKYPDNTALLGYTVEERRRCLKHPIQSIRYPLIEWGWTKADCMTYLTRLHAVPPIYPLGFERSGCWWCPNKSQHDLDVMARVYPNLRSRYDQLYKEAGR